MTGSGVIRVDNDTIYDEHGVLRYKPKGKQVGLAARESYCASEMLSKGEIRILISDVPCKIVSSVS